VRRDGASMKRPLVFDLTVMQPIVGTRMGPWRAFPQHCQRQWLLFSGMTNIKSDFLEEANGDRTPPRGKRF
jgi:hypothetical protein